MEEEREGWREERRPLDFSSSPSPGTRKYCASDRDSSTVMAETTSRFLKFGREGTLLSDQRSCGCKSWEQTLPALHLCVASGSLASDTDTVTGFAWQTREIKAPAFWPENQEKRLQRRKRARVKTDAKALKTEPTLELSGQGRSEFAA